MLYIVSFAAQYNFCSSSSSVDIETFFVLFSQWKNKHFFQVFVFKKNYRQKLNKVKSAVI